MGIVGFIIVQAAVSSLTLGALEKRGIIEIKSQGIRNDAARFAFVHAVGMGGNAFDFAEICCKKIILGTDWKGMTEGPRDHEPSSKAVVTARFMISAEPNCTTVLFVNRLTMQGAADELRKNELLLLAAHTGFLGDVENLIADGADVHSTDKEGTPLLHFPALKGKLDVVKLLLSKGAEVDTEDKNGQTALHFASQGNAYEAVKHLIKAGAWVDAYDANDDTALHLAIRGGHTESVKHLLMSGAKTEITNSRNLTALGEAITAKQADLVQLLIDKGADVHRMSKGFSLLHLASGIGSLPVLQTLLRHLSPETVVHPGGVTPLHCATLKSVPASVVRLLINQGSDPHTPDKNGKIPLDWAEEEGNANEEVLKLLSVGDRKKRSRRKSKSKTVTEIEPADGPEGEWSAFQRMSFGDKLKQVEVWARSKDDYLNSLVFLDDESRKAVALVGNFMRMLECRLAFERLKSDETFQKDAVDAQVQKAVAECTENPQNIRKFASNEKIVNVLAKLKRLQETLRRNGQMKIVYEELLNSTDSSQSLPQEDKMTIEELEQALKSAKEAVVKAVLGGSTVSRNQEEGGNWWGMEGNAVGDSLTDNLKVGPSAFFKSMLLQFLKQFFLAMLIFGVMVLGMYLTDSLPSQHPRYASRSDATISTPAFITDDRAIHARLNEPNFNPEL